jgi:hypothetical protein
MAADEQLERMEMDIDTELAELRDRLFAQEYEPGIECYVAKLLRLAFAKGMMDALMNPAKFKELLVTHGYGNPVADKH